MQQGDWVHWLCTHFSLFTLRHSSGISLPAYLVIFSVTQAQQLYYFSVSQAKQRYLTACVLGYFFCISGTAAVFHCLRTMLFFFVSQAQQRYLTACALCYFFCISGTAVGFPACVLCYFSVSQAQQLDFTACVLVCLSCISGTAAGSHCLHSWRFCFCRCSSSSTLNGQSVSCFWRRGKHQRHRREYGNDLCRCRARKAGSGTGPRAGSCHC